MMTVNKTLIKVLSEVLISLTIEPGIYFWMLYSTSLMTKVMCGIGMMAFGVVLAGIKLFQQYESQF